MRFIDELGEKMDYDDFFKIPSLTEVWKNELVGYVTLCDEWGIEPDWEELNGI